jgi:DNA repair exonuclease SbcCD nuclease subunit
VVPPISLATTIYDLDAEIVRLEAGFVENRKVPSHSSSHHPEIEERILRQAAHHATYKHWVVFSDLHCSPSTLDSCLEVLEIVHNTALQHDQKCGVLFLGDFWHHRGTLRVDCLNAILGALRSWKVPMLMIPGNHDQVTLGGENHGLTPLANAYRVGTVEGPLILSHPTVFRNALFVPHVRDADTMKAIVGSSEAHQASAMFVHAEVKGAMMNDMVISTNGISPSVFPNHKHIYSGHFHKPHSIRTLTSTFEYLGSPYQVSLSEAHQEKQLVVLDDNWQCQQRVPIRVGRRHFKLTSFDELQNVRVLNDDKGEGSFETSSRTESICVKKGDRIVITLPNSQQLQRGVLGSSDENAIWKSHLQSLREQGLMVELRESNSDNRKQTTQPNNTTGIPRLEELSPESTWRAYLEDAKTRDSILDEDCESLLRVGLGILEELEQESSLPDVIQNRGAQMDLRLTSMSVAGFGPFEGTIQYPLDNRGLVLLRGN